MKVVFVGNLYSGTTPAVIRAVFAPHGPLQSIDLMIDRATGLSRGFAFIGMADSEADSAIAALNGRIVDGHTINVREGRPTPYGSVPLELPDGSIGGLPLQRLLGV